MKSETDLCGLIENKCRTANILNLYELLFNASTFVVLRMFLLKRQSSINPKICILQNVEFFWISPASSYRVEMAKIYHILKQ